MQSVNVHLLLLSVTIVCFCGAQQEVISQPDDATICEGEGAVFTCVLNSNIRSDDVQWYRFIKDTSITVMVDPNGENINFLNQTSGNTTSTSLTITNAIISFTGYFWVETSSLNFCNTSLTVLARLPALTVYIMKNIENLSIVVQWDAVDDSLLTTYIITWNDNRDLYGAHTVQEQTSYTITGLNLDTVYTITVTAANIICNQGPEVSTSVSLHSTDTTSTTSTSSPTITASTTPIPTVHVDTVNPSSTITSTSSSTTIYNTATTTSTTFDADYITTTTTLTSTTTTAATSTAATVTTATAATISTSSSDTTPGTVTSYSTDTITTVTSYSTSAMATSTIYSTAATVIRGLPIVNTSSTSTTTTTIISTTNPSISTTNVNPGTSIISPTFSSKSGDATNENNGGSGNTGVIAGGVAGGLIVFFIFFIVLYIFCIRKREKAKDDSDELGSKPYKYNAFSRCLTCSNGPHTKDVPSVTNELALPHGEEHTPKDECEQEDKTDQQEEPCSPGGTHRRGSQKHFYTSANHPRDSLASILDDDEDDDDDGSQRTPYLILSPIQDGVQCILSHQRGEYATPPRQIPASDEYSVPRRNTISSISPRHAITSDEYSVPRSNSITGRPHQSEDFNPHPCAANDQYSVPRQGDDQYSIPRQSVLTDDSCQGPPDDQYSVPRQSDDLYSVPRQSDDQYSVPRQSDDQYSIPRQSVLTDDSCQGPPDDQYSVPRQSDDLYSVPRQSDDLYSVPRQSDDLYSVPRQSDDLYSVPRQSIIDDSIASSDTWYATPRQDMMNDANSHQIMVNDQCTVSRENAINNSANPHQSSGDDLYSVPRPNLMDSIPHQNPVHDIPHHSSMNDCTSAPDERYAAPRQGMNNNGTVSDQPKVEDEYAVPNSQTNTRAVPHQFRNGDVYAVPFPQVNNDPSITTDENVYFLPNPINEVGDSKTVDDDGYGSLSIPHVTDSDYVNLKNKKKKDKAKYVNSLDLQKLRKKNSAPGHH